MNNSDRQHIVIVGGGMVGLSLAVMLAETLSQFIVDNKIVISVIEQHEMKPELNLQASFDDRATALSAGSVEILKNMDCWLDIEAHAEKIKTVHVSDRGQFSGTQLDAPNYNLDALGYVIENKTLGSSLKNKIKHSRVNIIAPAVVKTCQAKKGAYHLQLVSQGNEALDDLHANLLIIADGANSPLRNNLGITTKTVDYDQVALIANVSLECDHNGIAYERFTKNGPLALLPLSKINHTHRASLVWTLPKDKVDAISSLSNEALVLELQKEFGYRAGKILKLGGRHLYPLESVVADEQIRSNLVVLGNAAHFLHPVAGQGFNLALRDCSTLSDTLLDALEKNKSIGDYSVLNSYLSKQLLDQEVTIGLTHGLVKTFSSEHWMKKHYRQLGLLALTSSSKAKNQFAKKLMGLNVNS